MQRYVSWRTAPCFAQLVLIAITRAVCMHVGPQDLTISLRSRQDVVQKEWRQQEKLLASGAPYLLRVSGMLLTQFCAPCLAIGHGAAALSKKLGSRLSDSNAEAIKLVRQKTDHA